jgi:hypothetical protein
MVENAIIGSGYGRMRDQIMAEKHRQVVDSTLGQDQVMVELTGRTRGINSKNALAARNKSTLMEGIERWNTKWRFHSPGNSVRKRVT